MGAEVTIVAGRPMELESPDTAMNTGYDKGLSLYKTGTTKPENLGTSIELHKGEYYRSKYYKLWVEGFSAGFLGKLKPSVA
jgi:hypothetical protein